MIDYGAPVSVNARELSGTLIELEAQKERVSQLENKIRSRLDADLTISSNLTQGLN